ncbi:uncharacterized protein N7515_009198 [Penicillium bovifimosum]|uniref:Uncharacterized protein n=1 Tax=Penicillium bovifimosum TaxID=126998 RepID=A0A9W9KVA1_9EURO|nr:uncharacterized protein N7515_009198 [Penicillium bovifimosum]KAJ5121237.1 hypothetical protein N7515_009198 [Penicillium bovifimosum]
MLKGASGSAPTDLFRKCQVADTWYNLRNQPPPKSLSALDRWILKWHVCYWEAKQVGLVEFENKEQITIDFLHAIAPVSPAFYAFWIMMARYVSDKTLPEFPALLNLYVEQVRATTPRKYATNAHATTFQGRDAGGDHSFSECPYVNPAVRSAGWEADKEANSRFKRAAKSPKFNASYTRL